MASLTWSFVVDETESVATLDGVNSDEQARGLVVLGHSAGGSMDSRLTVLIASELVGRGLDVVRFNFPYRAAGRKIPDRMPVLTRSFSAVADKVQAMLRPTRLFVGGHSMGGRASSVLAAEGFATDGLILFGYPLHPAGQQGKLRNGHLDAIRAPVFCANGTKDDLCERDLMEAEMARLAHPWTMSWIEDANHSLEVPRSKGESQAEVVHGVGEKLDLWLAGLGY